MAVPALTSVQGRVLRDHSFHRLRVERVVQETADACSFVFDVPGELQSAFAYEAGQFCSFRVWIDGHPHIRCYSMSSAPGVDAALQVTVKRVPGGLVSNWLLDSVTVGDTLEVTCPAGVFCLPSAGDVLAFAAGSGITPILSLVKAGLAGSSRRCRLLYANRDRESTIFASALSELGARHGRRLEVAHHLDVDDGYVDADRVRQFVGRVHGAAYFLCGPTPFMDLVEGALLEAGVDAAQIHVERFTPAVPLVSGPPTSELPPGPDLLVPRITIELDGRSATTDHHPGTTLLQAARQAGMAPPSSCESGSCATCMARLLEGTASMFVNNALTDDEVADGWVLTCQAVPTSPSVRVRYEGA